MTQPAAEDLLAIVDDPSGSPVTKKITRANLGKSIVEPTAKTSNYSVTASDETIFGDATSGTITFSLPAVSGTQGKRYNFGKTNSANRVDIDADGSETIGGSADAYRLINKNETVVIESTGTEWKVIATYGGEA